MKKTVLIFISNYLPGTKMGGPVTSIFNMVKHLSSNINFKIITSDRDLGDQIPYPNVEKNKWILVDNVEILYVKKGVFAISTILSVINTTKHDYIYLNSLFNPLYSINILFCKKMRLINSEIILAPRGELFKEALSFKPVKKFFFIKIALSINLFKNIIWHATQEREKLFIIDSINPSENNIKIAPVISSGFQKKIPVVIELSKRTNEGSLSIIFLARISKDKNLPYTLEILKNITFHVNFDIYGPIEDVDIWEYCKMEILTLPSNIIVRYLGHLDKELVHETLSCYDLFFLPTFAENFGHSIAESLSVGTPVLISDNTPWQNLDVKNWGWDISLENSQGFIESINVINSLSFKDKAKLRAFIIEDFNKSFNIELIVEQNLNLFHE
jgi:glycosyltransferase involved in cell wall biosynthesis